MNLQLLKNIMIIIYRVNTFFLCSEFQDIYEKEVESKLDKHVKIPYLLMSIQKFHDVPIEISTKIVRSKKIVTWIKILGNLRDWGKPTSLSQSATVGGIYNSFFY